MEKKLAIQWFIEQNENWEELLAQKPYCLSISREKWNGLNLIMFKYNQIESSFFEPIVRECRGLILNEDTLEPVSFPFYKFGNVSEGAWVEPISWDKDPYVLEKVDGSLIKVVKVNGELLISTNGTILASNAPVAEQVGCKTKNFGDLVDEAFLNAYKANNPSDLTINPITFDNWVYYLFEEGYTYMFELVSPWNKVVVPHNEVKMYFIGVRDNKTFEESFILDNPLSKVFDTPKLYKFSTFEECVNTAKSLPWTEEGYVITSRDFKRNKVKSLEYLNCHHLKNNGVMSIRRAIGIVQSGEIDEIVAYFPEMKAGLDEVKSKYEQFLSKIDEDLDKLKSYLEAYPDLRRKDYAMFIVKNVKVNSAGFMLLDGKISNANDWVKTCNMSFLVKALGFKDDE